MASEDSVNVLPWKAHWVAPVADPRDELGVFEFRNELELSQLPANLMIRVSADARFKLFVNEAMVAFGPQAGDLFHWHYDFLDIAPYLRPGRNVISALVWNYRTMNPICQMGHRTAFLFDVPVPEDREGPAECEGLITPGSWQVAKRFDRDFGLFHSRPLHTFICVGPTERIDGRATVETYASPVRLLRATPHGQAYDIEWPLIPRSLPPMRYERRETLPVERHGYLSDSTPDAPNAERGGPYNVCPGRPVVLDFGELLVAFPRFTVAGVAGTELKVTYQEALWTEDRQKGNRDDVRGKDAHGYQDIILTGEGATVFEPVWLRTFRYLKFESDEPVDVELSIYETGYPLAVESSFTADAPEVSTLWDVSVRTAQRCAGETYYDCPYYEQLQYAGDTRIQALIGYYLGRDRRLTRNAIETLGWSRNHTGLTQSRYPSHLPQMIPPFALWWVLMRQDQRLYDTVDPVDRAEAEPIDLEALDVANAFNRLSGEELDETYWNFGDWVRKWPNGVPPGGVRSTMHMLTLYLAHLAAEAVLDEDTPAARAKAKALFDVIGAQFERRNGLVRHRRDPEWAPSEHNEALWRLLQQRLNVPMDPWPGLALTESNAAECTYYFQYYKHQAMPTADYMEQLRPWREMIENGLTTFAENPEPTRSDCHAWSAHPILGFFQLVAGVTSAAPGWRKARIAPNPGALRRFDAKIAHPAGELAVRLEGDRLLLDVPVPFLLEWRGKSEQFEPGRYQI
jgi:hypothetical protein